MLLDRKITMQALTIIVINWVKPGCEEEYQRLLDPVLDAMRYEPTFINTILHQDAEDTARFMLYETWSDRDDFFEVQRYKSYRSEYEDKLPALLRSPREILSYTPLRSDYAFMHI